MNHPNCPARRHTSSIDSGVVAWLDSLALERYNGPVSLSCGVVVFAAEPNL